MAPDFSRRGQHDTYDRRYIPTTLPNLHGMGAMIDMILMTVFSSGVHFLQVESDNDIAFGAVPRMLKAAAKFRPEVRA